MVVLESLKAKIKHDSLMSCHKIKWTQVLKKSIETSQPQHVSFGCRLWGQQTEGADCGGEAGEWVSKHLGKPGARLLLFTAVHNMRTLQQAEEFFKGMNVELPQENPKVEVIVQYRFKLCDIILWSLLNKMCQSCLSFLILHWFHEKILMSVFR